MRPVKQVLLSDLKEGDKFCLVSWQSNQNKRILYTLTKHFTGLYKERLIINNEFVDIKPVPKVRASYLFDIDKYGHQIFKSKVMETGGGICHEV